MFRFHQRTQKGTQNLLLQGRLHKIHTLKPFIKNYSNKFRASNTQIFQFIDRNEINSETHKSNQRTHQEKHHFGAPNITQIHQTLKINHIIKNHTYKYGFSKTQIFKFTKKEHDQHKNHIPNQRTHQEKHHFGAQNITQIHQTLKTKKQRLSANDFLPKFTKSTTTSLKIIYINTVSPIPKS